MAGSVNKVLLIGNLCADPEIRRMQSGNQVASLRVATNESWVDKQTGERKNKAEYHSVIIFNEGLVKVVEQYVKKGAKLYIEGQLQTRRWQDQQGNDRYTTEIVLQKFRGELRMLDGKGGNDERSAQSQQTSTTTSNQYAEHTGRSARELDDADIPF